MTNDPQLGLATTRQLLEELYARFEIQTETGLEFEIERIIKNCPDDFLRYRTVDS